jgi:predicted RNA-binding protein with EMAP domain
MTIFDVAKTALTEWQSRRKRIKDVFDKVNELSYKIEGELSYARTIIEHDKKIAILENTIDNIKNTINTMFLIIDRAFGRNKDKKVKKDRRKNADI